MLRAAFHAIDDAVDVANAARLLGRGTGNGADMTVDHGDLARNMGQRTTGLIDERDAGADVFARSTDQNLDFLGSLRRPLGKLTHFLSDNRKALAGVSGAGCLDPSIEGQKVGLKRDLVDHADDIADLGGRFLDAVHRIDRTGDDAGRLFRFMAGRVDNPARLFGAQGSGGRCFGHLVQRAGRLLDGCGLLLGPLGEIPCRILDFSGGGADGIRRRLRGMEDGAQLLQGPVEKHPGSINCWKQRFLDISGQVAVGQFAHCAVEFANRVDPICRIVGELQDFLRLPALCSDAVEAALQELDLAVFVDLPDKLRDPQLLCDPLPELRLGTALHLLRIGKLGDRFGLEFGKTEARHRNIERACIQKPALAGKHRDRLHVPDRTESLVIDCRCRRCSLDGDEALSIRLRSKAQRDGVTVEGDTDLRGNRRRQRCSGLLCAAAQQRQQRHGRLSGKAREGRIRPDNSARRVHDGESGQTAQIADLPGKSATEKTACQRHE